MPFQSVYAYTARRSNFFNGYGMREIVADIVYGFHNVRWIISLGAVGCVSTLQKTYKLEKIAVSDGIGCLIFCHTVAEGDKIVCINGRQNQMVSFTGPSVKENIKQMLISLRGK